MEQDNPIDRLIAKFKAGTLTDEELVILADWYNGFDDTLVTLSTGDGDHPDALKARMHRRLFEKIKPARKVNRSLPIRWLPYAAAMLLAILGGWYALNIEPDTTGTVPFVAEHVAPGKNRAKLTLADGQTISLSEAQSGIRVGDGITYLDGSAVLENGEATNTPNSPSSSLNSLTTPRGGAYQIALPDGTVVWLNSASTLKYPSRFDGPERVVELEGEAYFDVREQRLEPGGSHHSQQKKPFKVISRGQEVEVLGTQFNISAYPDEQTKTTLVTGRVQVAPSDVSPIAIRPGQQSIVNGKDIRITAIDTSQYIAWKHGIFHFESTPLEEMLKQVARWYNVDVIYKQGIPKETFTGKFRRDVSLNGVVDILRLSLIDIRLEERTLIVN